MVCHATDLPEGWAVVEEGVPNLGFIKLMVLMILEEILVYIGSPAYMPLFRSTDYF